MTSPLEPEQGAQHASTPLGVPEVPPVPQDPLAVAEGLQAALTVMAANLAGAVRASEERDAKLKRYGRHNRLFIGVDVALTVVVSVALLWAAGAAQTADQARQAGATSCQAGNDQRHTIAQVFDHIFASFQPPAADTAAQKAAALRKVKLLEAYYRGKFAPRNCEEIYGVAPGTPSEGGR